MYGSLGKIEIFHDNINNTKFAHVTFKENRVAYFALIDKEQQEVNNIDMIRPADAHLQPDNPISSSSSSPFYNLPDDCLLAIFDYCDFHVLATLSMVCTKMGNLLRTRVFAKISKFNSVATNEAEVKSGLLTVSRLVQCINPSNFHLKINRNFQSPVPKPGWPAISIDMKSSMKSKISVELDFFKLECISELGNIAKRVKSIHLHHSIYDDSTQWKQKQDFANATEWIISGYANCCRISQFFSAFDIMPKLEVLFLRNGFIEWAHIHSCCEKAKGLNSITFEKCFFYSDVTSDTIIQIARKVKSSGNNNYPLRLMFDHIPSAQSMNCCSGNYRRCVCTHSAAQSKDQSRYDQIKMVINLF